MRILTAQLNPIIGDLEGNTRKILKTLDRAREMKVDIVLFPELSLCGYPPEDLLLHQSFIAAQQGYLEQIVRASSGLMVLVGLVRPNGLSGEKGIFNSAAVLQDGRLVGFQDKRLLPTYDVFDERRYFEPGKESLIWEYKGKRIGILICEDIWQHAGYVADTRYACDPVLDLKALKPDLVLNLSASPYQFQKPDVRVNVCKKCAKTLHCPVILCCQVGANDQLVFDGYSVYVDAEGELREVGKGFEEDEMLIDLESKALSCPFFYDPIQDLYKALVLGVRDYFHKSGFKKGCLGLSGGVDSALVACIAVDALGKDNVLALALPSRYSSGLSLKDAELLADHLGIELLNISIEKPFAAFLETLEPVFAQMPEDITEENLQSRIRGTLLMAISNKLGYIVLSTGNKSEMAMGYCTLYGDMCGGLSVISDVTKQQVYALCRWINRSLQVIPESILTKEPSAELRPNQKDSDSLPDYSIVDQVLGAYVERYLSPEQIAEEFSLPLELVVDLVKRIHRAEYKRRQSAPGIRVSKKAFRVGRRYPIVQGWM
ncbi:MAG: NAD+ synthase [Rhabdochlamydiaceae bacterium]|nr:NAD+ synthase [Rhabdochlamydiaceae bacterium]